MKNIWIPWIMSLLVVVPTAHAQRTGTPFGLAAENPGISAVGEILGRYDFDEPDWFGGLGNAELGFQAPIDPFVRADFLLHYSAGLFEHHHEEEDSTSQDGHEQEHEHGTGFAVEEALITFTSLPGGLQLSAGRMRSRIGILNVVHLHDFNFIEYPKIITDYWGHEGLSVDGLRLSWLAPLPLWTELVAEGQKTLSEHSTDLVTTGFNLFFPFGEDIGLSLSGFGYFDKPAHQHHEEHHEAEDHEHEEEHHKEPEFGLNGWGGGFRFKWKPTARALYTHLILQGELMNRTHEEEDHVGLYLMAEYLFSRQWTVGAMFQQLDLPHEKESESWVSGDLSFWPSEFQRLRLQYDHPVHAEDADPRISFQWTFIIGPHKPHSY